MDWILKAIIIIIVSYFIIGPKIGFIRDLKRKKGELLEGEEFSRQGNTNRAKISYFMFISSTIISIVFNIIFGCIKHVDIKISMILGGVLFFFLCECIIGSLWAFGREFILIYKTKGIFVAAFTFIFTIIILVAMMYVKYKNLIMG